ncbi:hypothetical protein K438DRAFT_1961894 [Mycena galopus ATCC 62051]|nr:hypothetical protein K438DRAFT_1961894 [Mycena galopus ATCC 62051]
MVNLGKFVYSFIQLPIISITLGFIAGIVEIDVPPFSSTGILSICSQSDKRLAAREEAKLVAGLVTYGRWLSVRLYIRTGEGALRVGGRLIVSAAAEFESCSEVYCSGARDYEVLAARECGEASSHLAQDSSRRPRLARLKDLVREYSVTEGVLPVR